MWVHLGKARVPSYLKTSMKNISENFHGFPLILLVDNDKNLKNLGIKNLNVKKVSFLDKNWESIKRELSHDLTFRNEFWFNSLARFKALDKFMENENLNALLHIESDVSLMPNFPIERVKSLENVMAYSLQSSGQGIASLLHVGSKEVLKDFLFFCRKEVTAKKNSTDMTILFRFLIERSHQVVILPTLPINLDTVSLSEDKSIIKQSSENINIFGGVFDAISIGQYFFGIDPRNYRGRKKLFREDLDHWVKPSQYEFKWINDSLIANNGGLQYQVYSLHIHSKDAKIFSLRSLKIEFRKRIKQSQSGERTELVLRELLKSIGRALVRRMGGA